MTQDSTKDDRARSDITRMARDGHLPVAKPAASDDDATVVVTPAPSTDDDATIVAPHASAGDDATVVSTAPPPTAAPSHPANVTPLALPVGYRLHEYRVDKVLGQGGFGITYLASDVNLNAKVAIKEYLPEQFANRTIDITVAPRSANDEEFYEKGLENYLVEARTLATFRHPHIVRVARFFEANNTAYMVLEYERGESLKSWWRNHADLPEADLLLLLRPLLDGLAVVHESGFLHRDIKPDNIYVRDTDGTLVLLDFGAARATSEQRTEENNFVTPGYGPIEQYVMGEQGPWTDIYAFGATLYWMVSGKKPIEAPDRMVDPDPLKPAVEVGKGRYSHEFLTAIDWALKPETQDRPRDVAAFRKALFAAHPSSLDLQDALSAGERVDGEKNVGWMAALRSPRLLKAKLVNVARSLVRPGSWPLAVKMTLAMVLTALTPMLLTAYYNYSGSVERVSTGELRDLEQLAGSVAGRVSQLISDSKNLAVYVSTDDDFVAFLKAPSDARAKDITAKLLGLAKANPDIQVATVLNANGDALASSFDGVAGRNFKFRQYFQEALAGRQHITGIIIGATAGEPGVFFANPVKDDRGQVIGVVTLRIRGSAIAAILEESRGNSARNAMLVDGDGVIIHHSDPWLIFKSLAPLPPETLKAIVADQRFKLDKIESLDLPELAQKMVGAKGEGNASYLSLLLKAPEIAGFAPVAGHTWVVAMSESREYFEAPLREMFRNVLYSVVLVGFVFVVLAVWFARTIVKPIERLTTAAHALKSGDYDQANVKVTSADEIGQLARVFNVMIDVLRQRERETGAAKKREARRSAKPPAV
ncbi:MAG: protein kinase [Betaproteobacteria bacterium]|nr:protein kinase [Betaproteobacteria bacterium]